MRRRRDPDQHGSGSSAVRDIHLCPQRADRGHEVDHPADLGFGLRIMERIVLRPVREHQQVFRARGVRLRREAPQLLGDEGHERMQQLEDLVAHPGRHRARFGLGRPVRALQHGLGELEIPVAVDIPDESVDGVRRLVEPVGLDRRA